jgi:outer membrane protein TolC
MRRESLRVNRARRSWRLAWTLTAGVLWTGFAQAQVPAQGESVPPKDLTREAAVRYALQNNPALMTVRQQQGYARSAVTMSRTYPFNPVYTGYVCGNTGPASADITNRVFLEQYVTLELELRGQGRQRRAAACATASRIDWEITQQEIAMSIAVIRACNAVLYRQQKLAALEETIKLSEKAFEDARRRAEGAKTKMTDVTLARIDLDSVRALRAPAKTPLTAARSELRRLLGTLNDTFEVSGSLEVPLPSTEKEALRHLALDQRPDLHARRAALEESEALLRLIRANRFGNPSAGPFFEYDPTRVATIGLRLSMPVPVLNTKRGEILKAETDVAEVISEVHQLEVQASQEVQAALSRWLDARHWVETYAKDIVPNVGNAKQNMEKLVAAHDPSADLSRLFSVERSYLKATETLLDARFEMSQAQADLALAVAEPALAIGPVILSASAMTSKR